MPSFDHDTVWKATWSQKKAIYGKKHLILVGGKTTEAAGSTSGSVQRRNDDTLEPVCMHPMPYEFYEDLVDGLFGKLVFDLVAVDAMLAWVCLCKRLAYVGITFNETGSELQYAFLFEMMKVHMAEVGHPRYDAAYAQAVGCKPVPDEGAAKAKAKAKTAAKAKAVKAKAKAAGKTEAKAKAKKPKVSGEDDEAEEGSDLMSGDDDDEGDDDVWDPLA